MLTTEARYLWITIREERFLSQLMLAVTSLFMPAMIYTYYSDPPWLRNSAQIKSGQ